MVRIMRIDLPDCCGNCKYIELVNYRKLVCKKSCEIVHINKYCKNHERTKYSAIFDDLVNVPT